MEAIIFRCSVCQQALSVGADNAGRQTKCSKCGTQLTVPASSQPAAAAARTAAEDDDGGTYGLKEGFEKPKTESADLWSGRKKKKKRAAGEAEAADNAGAPPPLLEQKLERRRGPRARFLLNPEEWRKVQGALPILALGLWIWLGGFVLHKVPVIIGMFSSSEYAKLMMRHTDPELYVKALGEAANPEDYRLDKSGVLVGAVVGNDNVTMGRWIWGVAALVMVGAWATLIVGYVRCLPVPPRFGTQFMLKVLLGLAAANIFFTLVLKLLPLVGAFDYNMIQVTAPEVAMTGANQDRDPPLAVFWSPVPFLESFGALLVWLTYYLEPVVLAAFLRGIALSMRSEKLEPVTQGMIRMGLGVAFCQLAYLMVSVTGSSEVMLWVLRFLYLLGVCFFCGQLAWFALVIPQVPPMIEKELGAD